MKKSIRFLTIVASFLLLVTCTSFTQIPTAAIGHWEGTTGTSEQSIKVVMNISDKKCSYDVPERGIYGQVIREYKFKGEKYTITIPEKDPIILKGIIKGNQMTGEVSGKTSMTFLLEKKSTIPEFFYEEEVTYKSGNVTLSGTLIKPDSSSNYPVVVMIHGSAGQGKMTREITRSRAILFVKSGIAALIYDRRGNGKSTGEDDRILKMDLLTKDAAAGVEFLSTRPDIDKAKIGVYGLSQGGWVAPYTVNFTDKVNFVITVSAPGITPDEQNDFAAGNYVSTIINDNIKKAGGTADEHKKNEIVKTSSTEEIIPGFSHFNPLPYWSKIKVPVLAIWGQSDKVVPAEQSKKLIEESLSKGGNTSYTLKIFPEGDHILELASVTPDNQKPFKLMVPGVQEYLTQWIQVNLKKK